MRIPPRRRVRPPGARPQAAPQPNHILFNSSEEEEEVVEEVEEVVEEEEGGGEGGGPAWGGRISAGPLQAHGGGGVRGLAGQTRPRSRRWRSR